MSFASDCCLLETGTPGLAVTVATNGMPSDKRAT
jgi:hypothetical protein